jgi:hypothetical protein
MPGGLTRLHRSLYAAAWKIARPSPTRAFTSELSLTESPRVNVGYHYAGNQLTPATGLAPVGHVALRAAADEKPMDTDKIRQKKADDAVE